MKLLISLTCASAEILTCTRNSSLSNVSDIRSFIGAIDKDSYATLSGYIYAALAQPHIMPSMSCLQNHIAARLIHTLSHRICHRTFSVSNFRGVLSGRGVHLPIHGIEGGWRTLRMRTIPPVSSSSDSSSGMYIPLYEEETALAPAKVCVTGASGFVAGVTCCGKPSLPRHDLPLVHFPCCRFLPVKYGN